MKNEDQRRRKYKKREDLVLKIIMGKKKSRIKENIDFRLQMND